MFFLNPTYLWSLLGLLVPLAIHLWSRKEGKTIKVGSIQFLTESTSKQSSSLHPNEFLLLVIRLLLLGLLVLIISGPSIRQEQPKVPITYIVEPSLFSDEQVKSVIDTIDKEIPIRLLQRGFPQIDIEEPITEVEAIPDYWQLAQEMHHIPTDSIVVLTNAYARGLKGKRPDIQKNVNWVLFDDTKKDKNLLKAIKSDRQTGAYLVTSDSYQLSFSREGLSKRNKNLRLNKTGDSIIYRKKGQNYVYPLKNKEEIGIALLYEEDLLDEMKYCKAAFKAISKYMDVDINLEYAQTIDSLDFSSKNLVVWLHQGPAPDVSTKLLTYRPDSLAFDIIQPGKTNNEYFITKPLTTENLLKEHFVEKLIKILDIHYEEKQLAKLFDKRVVGLEEFLPKVKNIQAKVKTANAFDISEILWLIVVFLVLVERILAKYRKQ